MRALGVILARKGSKGIPRKNLAVFRGRPLIDWTLEAANDSGLHDLVCSTDCPEVAFRALKAGVRVVTRPPELATDDADPVAAERHALRECGDYDVIVRLQPTSPLRAPADIDACLRLITENGCPAVVTVSEARTHPWECYRVLPDGRLSQWQENALLLPRQRFPACYERNGAVFAATVEYHETHGGYFGPDTYAHLMPADRSLDIDTKLDLLLGEALSRETAVAA